MAIFKNSEVNLNVRNDEGSSASCSFPWGVGCECWRQSIRTAYFTVTEAKYYFMLLSVDKGLIKPCCLSCFIKLSLCRVTDGNLPRGKSVNEDISFQRGTSKF